MATKFESKTWTTQRGITFSNHYTPEHWTTKHPELPIGEIINDFWVRTPIRSTDSSHSDNYFYAPDRCYCNDEVSAGYTFNDEYGDCDFCNDWISDIEGRNEHISISEARELIEEYLIDLQSGKFGIPTIEELQNAGNLHRILEVL